jgi:hypothetical protein
MAWAIDLAISVCERRGLKLPTAGASGPPALNRRSMSASYFPAGGASGAGVRSVKVAFQCCEDGSGRNIRNQLHFQQGDMVFQLQFALFQAPELQLVVVAIEDQHVYDRVQVPMFHIEFDQAALNFMDIGHVVAFQTVLFQELQECGPRRALQSETICVDT